MVDALEQRIAPLERIPAQIQRLAELGAPTAPQQPDPVPSWMAWAESTDEAHQLITDLEVWLQTVFLSYSDTGSFPRECWLYHPDVVEELIWLRALWVVAYDFDGAKPAAAADWHDRYRPNAVKRICGSKSLRGTGYAGGCTIENHQGNGKTRPLPPGPDMPEITITSVTAWWTDNRNAEPPDAPLNARQQLS